MTVDVAVGERLFIGDSVVVEVVAKSGQQARLRVLAPREDRIDRRPAGELQTSMAR
jgi:sRNA-binding carbon storage regulator CsrA